LFIVATPHSGDYDVASLLSLEFLAIVRFVGELYPSTFSVKTLGEVENMVLVCQWISMRDPIGQNYEKYCA